MDCAFWRNGQFPIETLASHELPDQTVIGHLDEAQRTSVEARCEQVEEKDWTALKTFDSALMATRL